MDLEKTRFKRKVFEGLFYLASDRGANPIPSIEEFLVSELLGGAYEYVSEKESVAVPFRFQTDRHFWTTTVNNHLKVLDEQNKFNPALAEAIKYWAHIEWCHDHGESWRESQIRYWLMFGDHNRMQSTMAFTVPKSREIEEGLESIDSDTLRHMENIAEIMKKYMKADLEYIRQHYGW